METAALSPASRLPGPAGRMRSGAMRVALAALAVVALVELAFRFVGAPPRVALVRASAVPGFRVVDDIPVWGVRDALAPCATRRPTAARIAFLGTSITYGSGVRREQSFPHLVERLL